MTLTPYSKARPTVATTEKDSNKITVVAPFKFEKASVETAQALSLPPENERQMDLQYLTCIFVSSGMNKNGAVFLGSELCKARGTIAYKAVDIEHDERAIIGQIMGSAYMHRDGTILDPSGLLETSSLNDLDMMDMDIAASCIIHKARFPEIADEINRGEWMVSMEAYYRDYDVKVGDLIIPREQATILGYDKLIGTVVRVKDGGKELGYHLVGRVLRDITFSGVGIVKNPANERSIIMEAAAVRDFCNLNKEHASIVNLADIAIVDPNSGHAVANTDITEIVRNVIREELALALPKEQSGLMPGDLRPGTCVHFKKEVVTLPAPVMDEPATDLSQYPLFSPPGGVDSNPPGTTIAKENHCNLFDLACSSRPGDATAPTCWRNVFATTVKDELSNYEEIVRSIRSKSGNLVKLQNLIDEARKFKQ